MILIYYILIGEICLYTDKILILDYLLRFSTVLIFLGSIIYNFKKKFIINYPFKTFFFYYLILIICSILNKISAYGNILLPFIITFSLILIISNQIKNDISKTISDLTIVFSSYIYLNFITILIYPEGMWIDLTSYGKDAHKFIIGGNHNQMAPLILVGIVCNYLDYYYNKKNLSKLIFICLISILSLLIVGSKTAIVGILCFISFIIIQNKRLREISFFCLLIFYIVFQIYFIFTLSDISSNVFLNYLVVDVLGKDPTFSTRTNIWFWSLYRIIKSPIIGYGVQPEDWYKLNINGIMPHNYIYSILINGGIILLIWFILYFIKLIKDYRLNYTYKPVTTIIFSIGVFFIMMMMEVYNVNYLVILTILNFYCILYKDNQIIFRNTNKKIKNTYKLIKS